MAYKISKQKVEKLKRAISILEDVIADIKNEQPSGEPVGTCVRDGEVVHSPSRLVRGLCPRCYSLLKSRVDAGETTWKELEAKGLAVSGRKTGRRKLDI